MSIDQRKAHARKDIDASSQQLQKNSADAGGTKKHSKADRRKQSKLAQKDKQLLVLQSL